MIYTIKFILFFLVFLSSTAAVSVAGVVQPPKTGQNICYSTTNCIGSGQDGELQLGTPWPLPRFIVNGDQTVTDLLTGLVWTQNANQAGTTKTWQGALDYVKDLSQQNHLGYSDWRLPNRKELMSLVNWGQSTSYAWLNTQGFSSVQGNGYWSSSSIANNTRSAWFVDMFVGYVGDSGDNDNNKFRNHYVWPVRGSYSDNPTILVSPENKEFGSITTETTSAEQSIVISNTGTAVLAISNIVLTGNDSASFILYKGINVWGSTCGATPALLPGKNCTVIVVFSPNSIGVKASTLQIASNDPAVPNKDISLTGTSSTVNYTIGTSVVGGNGFISCDRPVYRGANSICEVTPASSYQLATLTDNGVDKIGNIAGSNYTIFNVTENHAIVATFTLIPPVPVNGTCGTSHNGIFSAIPVANLCSAGTVITLTGTGSWRWNCAGTSGGTTASCNASIQTYTINCNVTGGNGTVTCTSPVGSAGTSTCTITPASGYQVSSFIDNNVDKTGAVAGDSYIISGVSANHTIGAIFGLIPQSQFTVTPAISPNYTITPATPQIAANKTTTTFTVYPSGGYGVVVSGCDGSLSGITYTTGSITANCTVNVTAVARNASSGSGNTSPPTITDALKVLQSVVGLTTLNATEKIRYDVAPLSTNGIPLGNGSIDAADVILILRRSIGIGSW